jgi:hypothetical protein
MWLALNGGIKWVSINEREKAVNEGGVKEDTRRKKNIRERTFGFWGVSIILREERIELLVWGLE